MRVLTWTDAFNTWFAWGAPVRIRATGQTGTVETVLDNGDCFVLTVQGRMVRGSIRVGDDFELIEEN